MFFLTCLLAPRAAHRIVGYLGEEAVVSYTRYLSAIDAGGQENVPAPKIVIDYRGLPEGAKSAHRSRARHRSMPSRAASHRRPPGGQHGTRMHRMWSVHATL